MKRGFNTNYLRTIWANIILKKGELCPIVRLVVFPILIIFTIISCSTNSVSHRVMHQECNISLPNTVDSLDRCIQELKKTDNKPCLLSAYKKLGQAYYEKNRFSKAVIAFTKGLEITQSMRDTLGIVQCLNSIGENCRYLNDYNQASIYYYKAFSYSKVFSRRDEKKMIRARVQSLNGMGKIFVAQKNWLMADSAYNTALECEIQLDNLVGKAECYANIGYVYESTNKVDSAWAYYRKAMMYSVEARSEYGMSMCHLHFGELYEKDSNWDMALKEYFWANELLRKNHEKWYWMQSCISIARVYVAQNNVEKVKFYLEKARRMAEETGSVKHLAAIYQLYYQWYDKHNDSRRALDNYILSTTYADSIMNLVKLNQMYNTRLQFIQGDHQNALRSMTSNYTNEKDLRRMLVVSTGTGSIIVSIIIIILLFLLRSKRRMAIVMKRMECIRSDFFTNVTHEFRTPLSVILGLSEQLEKGSSLTKEELQKMGNVISYQGGRLLDLVNQLLDVSKIQSSLGTPKWCRGNIVTYIDMLVQNYQSVVSNKHLELVFLSREKEVEMDFISDYIDKIMRNLMSNAYKFTPEYGKIYITASAEKDDLVIHVADTGQGISDADKPHIFDPFYQGDNKSFTVGTGIGLSLVHQLVLAMNGTIQVKSSVNAGTVFILKFPLKRKYSEDEEYDVYSSQPYKNRENVSVESEDLPEGKEKDDVSPLILIVEDNTDVAYYIGSQLKETYTLKYARNGKVALELAKDLVPNLIITDILMPEMDGYELCRSIRASRQLNHIPVIMLSVLNSEDERIKGLESGADAYLCKPFNSKELNERLTYLLGERRLLRQKFSQDQKEKEEAIISEADQQFLNKLTDITYSVMSSGNVTVEDIASKMLMGRQQINRKIHALTGENTVNYLMRIRLNRAKILLDSPQEYLIGEIALECGFEDVAYFSRSFKKLYNVTPSQYRKRVKD